MKAAGTAVRSGFVPGDLYGSRIGLVGYLRVVVNSQHQFSCLIIYLFFLLSFSLFSLFLFKFSSVQLLSSRTTVLVILTLLHVFSVNVFQVLKEVIPKDKNVFVIYQNVQKWMSF